AVVGDFYHTVGADLVDSGYILSGSSFTVLTVPGSPLNRMTARGINNAGEVVGWANVGGVTEGYVYDAGVYQFISDPNAVTGTFSESLNTHGIAPGKWNDASGDSHAFEYDTHTGVFTEINVPGATNENAFGIDDLGRVVINTDIAVGPNNFIFTAAPEPA